MRELPDPAVRKAVSVLALASRRGHGDPEVIDEARYHLAAEKAKVAVRKVADRWPDRWDELLRDLAEVRP
jgi:hypothetical protein